VPPPDRYRPSPIPTSGVTLPSELDALLERLAEHVHDLWALGRMAENWTWGEQRSDEARTHPDLVPYPELGEGEKAFDRTTARETLLAVLALGYRIIPPEQSAHHDEISASKDAR
jgi:hypothetical protein